MCYIQDMVYVVHLELDKPVAEEFEVRAGGSSVGKVDVLLQKSETGVRWSRVGKTLAGHGEHIKAKDFEVRVIIIFCFSVISRVHYQLTIFLITLSCHGRILKHTVLRENGKSNEDVYGSFIITASIMTVEWLNR